MAADWQPQRAPHIKAGHAEKHSMRTSQCPVQLPCLLGKHGSTITTARHVPAALHPSQENTNKMLYNVPEACPCNQYNANQGEASHAQRPYSMELTHQ
jgi:hypothetical protein